MKTVGLNDKDTRLYFVSKVFVIMDNPETCSPVVVLRSHIGFPTDKEKKEIREGLKRCSMKLTGASTFRKDGLWVHPVVQIGKEASNERYKVSDDQESRQRSEGSV